MLWEVAGWRNLCTFGRRQWNLRKGIKAARLLPVSTLWRVAGRPWWTGQLSPRLAQTLSYHSSIILLGRR
jgi:hypothetical protein